MKKQLSNPCTIYLVRHGETDYNLEFRVQGHVDTKLNPKGIKQAKSRAKHLKNIKFDAAYSSDLIRAKKTAEIIATEHNLTVLATKLIRERSFGHLEGRHWNEIMVEMKDLFDHYHSLATPERFKYKPFKAYDSDEELVSNLITFLRELALTHANKTVLVVSHGGLMRAFLVHLGYANNNNYDKISIKNTGYIKFESDGVEFDVLDMVDIEY